LSLKNKKKIDLIYPCVEFKESFLKALNEFETQSEKLAWIYLGDNEPLDTPSRNFQAYIDKLNSAQKTALPNFVRNKVWWAIVEGEVVGRISLRLELNDFLKKAGGHIGYIVRSNYRGLGIATKMLETVLKDESSIEIGKLLLTCDVSNIASEKTIVKNGGVYEGVVELCGREDKKRFWINME
jgi:predicted acetyltransferase